MFSVALLLLLAAGSCVKCEQLTQPASVTVQPGQRLTITCQVSYSVSSYYTAWIRQPAGKGLEWIGSRAGGTSYYKDSLKNKFSIELDSSSNTVTLIRQNVQPEDTAVYYCARHIWYGAFDYWGKGTMVTITSATSTGPTVFPLTTCSSDSGSKVTLGCLATGFTPSSLTFAWNKNGTAVSNFIQYPAVQKGSHYMRVSQIDVTRQDWDAMYGFQCAVTHPAGNAQTRYIIKPPPIPEPPCQQPTLKVLASSDEDNEISFSCFAKDFSPKDYEIKWLKNDVEITSEIYNIKTKPEEIDYKNGTILYNAGSFLTMRSSDVPVKTKLTCQFKGRGANCDAFKNATIIYSRECTGTRECLEADVEINIEGPSLESMFLNKEAIIKCQVKVNRPGVEKIFWEDESGKEMADAVLIPSNGRGTFTLPLEITYDEWSPGVKRYCVVEHRDWYEPMKKVYERNIGGQIERPSVFMLPPVEHAKKQTVTLTCYVKDFFPQDVFVSWLVDDEPANSEYEFSTTNPVKSQRDELYSAYGQLSLSLDQWKQNDIVYSCVVYHQSVANSTKAIVRSIGHRTFEKTNLVNLNMNVPETCKAQ